MARAVALEGWTRKSHLLMRYHLSTGMKVKKEHLK